MHCCTYTSHPRCFPEFPAEVRWALRYASTPANVASRLCFIVTTWNLDGRPAGHKYKPASLNDSFFALDISLPSSSMARTCVMCRQVSHTYLLTFALIVTPIAYRQRSVVSSQ